MVNSITSKDSSKLSVVDSRSGSVKTIATKNKTLRRNNYFTTISNSSLPSGTKTYMKEQNNTPKITRNFCTIQTLPKSMPTIEILSDSGASHTVFKEIDASALSNIGPAMPFIISMPNGTTALSTTAGTLSLPPSLQIPVRIFPNESLDSSLLAISDLSKQECETVLTDTTIKVTHVPTGTIVIEQSKIPAERLWRINIPAIAKCCDTNRHRRSINAVISHQYNADLVAYAHATFGSAPESTFLLALSNGWLGNYPYLTTSMYRANRPNSEATSKGYLDRVRQPDHNQRAALTSEDREKIYTRTKDINHSDLTGKFPFQSLLGNQYVLCSEYRGYLYSVAMKDKTAASYVRAYKELYTHYRDLGFSPEFQRMDNETSEIVEEYFKSISVKIQYVPPDNHRANQAERAIRHWKNFFIATLSTVDPNFPMSLWDQLIPQVNITINHLRPSDSNQKICAYAAMNGSTFDFIAHPLHVLGTRAQIFQDSSTRESWSPHSVSGWYVGPALRSIRSYRCVTSTYNIRTTDTITLHPAKLILPGASSAELLYSAVEKLSHEVEQLQQSKSSNTIVSALLDTVKTLQSQQISVPLTVSSNSASNQRVALPAVDPVHPLTAPKRTPTFEKQYRTIKEKDVRPKKLEFFYEYIGRSFIDTNDGSKFTVSDIVVLKTTPLTKVSRHKLFFQYYDTSLYNSDPRSENLQEHTPVSEFFTLSKGKYSPILSMATWQNAPQLNSTYHRSTTDPILNQNNDGSPLTLRKAFKGPDAKDWSLAREAGLAKILDRKKMRPIIFEDIPFHRRRDITYYKEVPKEKLDSSGTTVRTIRGTIGGDKLHYDGRTMSQVASDVVIKLHIHTVVSDRRNNGTNTRFCTLDLGDFFMTSDLDRPEYIRIPLAKLSDTFRAKYNLDPFIHSNSVVFEVTGNMPGHPAAGRLAKSELVSVLKRGGYHEHPDVPCLFENPVNKLSFTLLTDDFGIKYTDMAHVDALKDCLTRAGYTFTFDPDGAVYNGMRLQFNYIENKVTLDMPNVIPSALARFCPNGPPRPSRSPSYYSGFTPGKSSHLPTTEDESPLLDDAGKQFVQQVAGTFLHYARAIDYTMLPATVALTNQMSAPREKTRKDANKLLSYAVKYPNNQLVFHACDMVYYINSDASHLSLSKSGSQAGGVHYSGNKGDPYTNCGIHYSLCKRLPTVCSSASESEYGGLFLNGRQGAFTRTVYDALHYPQGPTRVATDNTVARGIAMDEVTLRSSKSNDMQYNWFRDRCRRKQFYCDWVEGKSLDADFLTKVQPAYRHENFIPRFVHVPTTTLPMK